MKIIEDNKKELLKNIDTYYKESKELANKFGGPSIYFHRECIEAGKKEYLGNRHIEMLYATLTAWGMHRMGDTQTKLKDFPVFKKSIIDSNNDLIALKEIKLKNLENHKDKIKNIFMKLEVSISKSYVVANSKTMFHLLWDIIPPIDREHTFNFYYGKNIDLSKKTKEEQLELFWDIVTKMKEIIESKEFKNLEMDYSTRGFYPSNPKIVDDLIMSFVEKIKNDRKD